ncbi:hypothetical protein, partial [Bacillus sp. MUM 13]|uniref:hypothetical protein n=1 Tax=Bacillus sp. MUM 13 TaxID=1678001 RepID=UPI00196ABAA9
TFPLIPHCRTLHSNQPGLTTGLLHRTIKKQQSLRKEPFKSETASYLLPAFLISMNKPVNTVIIGTFILHIPPLHTIIFNRK